MSLSSQGSDKKLIVAIDPGHGGYDEGATVLNKNIKIKESDLTLLMSRKIIKLISEKYKNTLEVFETRNKNIYIPLQNRVENSINKNADVYISLHYNSNPTHTISGTEIYFPQSTVNNESKSSVLNFIKSDLIETGRLKKSLQLSRVVSSGLASLDLSSNIKIRRAPFYVLDKNSLPSILVEIGYLTNPHEQIKLLNEDNQNLIADSIAHSLIEFKEIRDK